MKGVVLGRNGIVDNVIKLEARTAYELGQGNQIVMVPEAMIVGLGMRLITGSDPVQFEDYTPPSDGSLFDKTVDSRDSNDPAAP